MLDELYQELILDHYKNPRCLGCLDCPGACVMMNNPLCGDKVRLSIKVHDSKLSDIAFEGQGCSISQASASMMSELCKGKSVSEVRGLREKFKSMMQGKLSASACPELGDVGCLEGVSKIQARVRCAMLAWEALERCLDVSEQSIPHQVASAR